MGNIDGRWSDDHTHFIFDYEKISLETGWSVDEIRMRGVSYCRRSPRLGSSDRAEVDARGMRVEHDEKILYRK